MAGHVPLEWPPGCLTLSSESFSHLPSGVGNSISAGSSHWVCKLVHFTS